MQAVPVHSVPAGPLAVRWLAYELEPPQAGALGRATIELENAGAEPWREASARLPLARRARQRDRLGRPAHAAPPARARCPHEVVARVRAPMPPGRYRLAFDLVVENLCWLSEIGNELLDGRRRGRAPRRERRRRAPSARGRARRRTGTRSSRAAHEEGYAAVGGAIESRDRALRAVPARRRPQPVVHGAARLPVAAAAAGAELRGRRPPRLAPAGRRALDLRRPDQSAASAVGAATGVGQ